MTRAPARWSSSRPRDPGEGRHLRLRADGLLAHPRRQRAAVRRLLAAQAVPGARGLRGRAGGQRHGHQRQDLHGGAGGGRGVGGARARDDRRTTSTTPSASGSAGRTPSRSPPSTSSRSSTLIGDLDRRRPRLRGRRRRLLPRPLAAVLRRALAPRRSTRWTRARASRAPTARRIRSTSRSGRAQKADEDTSWDVAVGPRPARAGTSSARRWPRSCWASSSTSTAAASTCSSRTTRTRPRRRWPRAASRSRASGCTTGCSSSPTRRCRSPRATSAG